MIFYVALEGPYTTPSSSSGSCSSSSSSSSISSSSSSSSSSNSSSSSSSIRLCLKCDDTRAETRFRLSAKRTSPFKSARGALVQSTTGSRGVRISVSSAGYTMFRGSVKSTGYTPTPSASLPFTSPPVRHRLP